MLVLFCGQHTAVPALLKVYVMHVKASGMHPHAQEAQAQMSIRIFEGQDQCDFVVMVFWCPTHQDPVSQMGMQAHNPTDNPFASACQMGSQQRLSPCSTGSTRHSIQPVTCLC